MKSYISLILSLVCINFGYGQKIKVSEVFPITTLENSSKAQVTGYNLADNKLEIYSLMPISGVMTSGNKVEGVIKQIASKESDGSPLFIKNVVDINTFKNQLLEENTIVSHTITPTENTKFIIKTTLTTLGQDNIKRIISPVEIRREIKDVFPLGFVSTTNFSGKFGFDYDSGKLKFTIDPSSITTYERKANNDFSKSYSDVNVEPVKDSENKLYTNTPLRRN